MELTEQQLKAIDDFVLREKNVLVQAVPGAGKSTLLIEICKSFIGNILVMAYNTELCEELSDLIKRNDLEHRVQCYTFHSLCSNYVQLSPDDITFQMAIENLKYGVVDAEPIVVDAVLIDEVQDLKDLYVELINMVVQGTPQFFLCGDYNQMLYNFDPDSMANLDIMAHPGNYFKRNELSWSFHECNISHRITHNMATLVNKTFNTNITSSKNHGSKVIVRCPSKWKVAQEIIKHVPKEDMNNTMLLTPTKNGNRPLKILLNTLSEQGYYLHIHSSDTKTDFRMKNGKLEVNTFHSSKGRQMKNVIVLVNNNISENPLYVALTRSFENLIIILDSQNPHKKLCQAIRLNYDNVDMDEPTKKIVAMHAICEVPEETESTRDIAKQSSQRSIQKSRAKIGIYKTFSTEIENMPNDETEYDYIVNVNDNKYENVSNVYEQAVKLYIEYTKTSMIRCVEDCLHPTRMEYEKQSRAIELGVMSRFVSPSISENTLLPTMYSTILKETYNKSEKNSYDYAIMALMTLSWDDFHHYARQLFPVENWFDCSYFGKICNQNISLVGEDSSMVFDVRMKCHYNNKLLHLRAHMCTTPCITHFVWSRVISQSNRADAAIRASMHPRLKCRIINLLTGETNIISVQSMSHTMNCID